MISAYIDDELAANAGFKPVSLYEKCRHRAEFGISVKKKYWGMGIGFAVMEAIIDMAKEADFEQMELEVVETNERGIALYKKAGFEIYGKRKKSFKYRDGSTVAEYLMILDL